MVLDHLSQGEYDFIYCHINGPDEASHMNDLEKKIYSIEQIDYHILRPVYEFMIKNPDRLGAVAICPDHYTNINLTSNEAERRDAHSLDPVPFAIWGGEKTDDVMAFTEKDTQRGCYTDIRYSHLDLLSLMIKNPDIDQTKNADRLEMETVC